MAPSTCQVGLVGCRRLAVGLGSLQPTPSCCTDQLGYVWGRVGVEDHPSFRDFAVVGQDYRRPVNLSGRQIRLSSPRLEDATPSIVLRGYPPVPFNVNDD